MKKFFLIFCIFISDVLFSQQEIVAKVAGFNPFSSPPKVNIDKGRKDGVEMKMKFKILRDATVIGEGEVSYLEEEFAYLDLTYLKEGEKLNFSLKAVASVEKKLDQVSPKHITFLKIPAESKEEKKEAEKQLVEKIVEKIIVKKEGKFRNPYYGEYYYHYLTPEKGRETK